MRIRTKLIFWYGGLLAIIIVVFGALVYNLMVYTLVDTVDSTLNQTAELVIKNSRIRQSGGFGPPNQREILLPPLDLFRASGVGVQVWDLSSQPEPFLAESSNNIDGYELALDPAALGSIDPQQSNVIINGRQFRVLTRPVVSVGQLFANVQVVAPLDTVIEARERMLLVMVASGAVGVLGSAVLGWWLSGKALEPIEQITEAAGKIAQTDDLSTRLGWQGPMDELGRLTSVFNQMMERLEQLFGLQRRFVADVSHELRTPLTAIRGNLDLIKRYGADEMSLEAIESEARRMSRMVDDLLLLARADYGGLTLDMEAIDLDTIVMEAYRQGRVLTKDRDLGLAVKRVEPVRISGNPDRMKQVLLNLIGNAIKFTPDGGSITLDLTTQGNKALISVTDTGIGINTEDQKHIFDRFYQVDPSRTRDGELSSGLGLSIAKWIVEAHQGAIYVESVLGRGATFTLELPILKGIPSDGNPHHTHSQHDDEQELPIHRRIVSRLTPER